MSYDLYNKLHPINSLCWTKTFTKKNLYRYNQTSFSELKLKYIMNNNNNNSRFSGTHFDSTHTINSNYHQK